MSTRHADGRPLVLEHVSRAFGSGTARVNAVSDVSLAVEEGEIVAIVGPSGCGKTTLLSMAGCLLTPTSGRVSILGEDVGAMKQAQRAAFRLRHIGFVFQAYHLLAALNVRQNVEIALNLAGMAGSAAFERAEELLALFELDHRARTAPGTLGGGEQQRLAIARALANRPDIILADEPTASLDSRAGHRVMELLRAAVEAGHARSMVVVTHDTRILGLAHRVLPMEDGQLAPCARPAQENRDACENGVPAPGQ
jgi:putative ABC transport system ATP-binding protein